MENEGFRLRTLHEKSHEPIVYIGLLRASNLLGLVLLTGYPLPFVRILSMPLTFQGINKKIEQHEVWPWSPIAPAILYRGRLAALAASSGRVHLPGCSQPAHQKVPFHILRKITVDIISLFPLLLQPSVSNTPKAKCVPSMIQHWTITVEFSDHQNTEIVRHVLPRTKKGYNRTLALFDK